MPGQGAALPSVINREIQAFVHGCHNLLDEEIIPQDSASDELNWYTQDARIKLVPGKYLIGAAGIVGSITGEIFGYKTDGTKVHWRKAGSVIQYLNSSGVWTTTISGLTSSADYSFTNYSSLAGAFTFAIGVDGIFKMNNANPGSYIALYDSSKNFKGRAFIDKGRMILWNRPEDKTGLYGSKIDPQNSTVYTSVSGEATVSLGGTLAFKGGGANRNCFGVTITLTGTGEVYTDNFAGVLTGSLGGTGTINYITGAYTLSNAGVGTAAYQWEDSNVGGVTDFTKSSPRTAGQGFQFPQDEGGDAILNVMIGTNGYYSMKSQSAYLLTIDGTDLIADNNVYRKQLGIPSWRACISTALGIVFLNTSNPAKPEMTILQKDITGTSIEPKVIFPQFKFANYLYDDCTIDTYERYVLLACKSSSIVPGNDIILLCDVAAGTVDILGYSGRTFVNDSGNLYMGSSVSQSVYQLFSGFDDDGYSINNFYISKGETYAIKSRSIRYALFGTSLKKYRKMRFKGSISPDQSYGVYISYDDAGYQLVGTILGTGSYVDYSSPQTIGSNLIGSSQIGGDDMVNIYPYYAELRLKKMPKFRKRKVKLVALGIGYVDVNYQIDWDISIYENKIPARFRQKQNVTLDGEDVDQPTPQF